MAATITTTAPMVSINGRRDFFGFSVGAFAVLEPDCAGAPRDATPFPSLLGREPCAGSARVSAAEFWSSANCASKLCRALGGHCSPQDSLANESNGTLHLLAM
jgi:hypothetical protein